jgi:hypothetical protein
MNHQGNYQPIQVIGELLFELSNKQDWVNKVPRILPDKIRAGENFLWVDKNGSVFECGSDFSVAEQLKTYPCRVYRVRNVASMNTWVPEDKDALIKELTEALQKVADWELPETGLFWDMEEKKPMSYAAAFGTNGSRDYFKKLAKQALQPKEPFEPIPYHKVSEETQRYGGEQKQKP